ncbi:MAG: nickel pincer cofactor biosynthesis protein LarC [Symploca sp. SIO1C4]|uniref:Putative nickel insertion protein n=1 Tax=Symploca sp. SIO1C4 TaxID=2607765 RepID=A0A6B3NFT8_9CYAN|nr:nickel pincer cofactor biosynthesis protein LarC [Symploca sp. SIO1C4]
MIKLAYLDCPTGIAGDMCLGALVAAGVPLEYLTDKLKGLGIEQEYRLWAENVHRNGQLATKAHVDLLDSASYKHQQASALKGNGKHQEVHHHDAEYAPARHLPEIERLIIAAELPERVCQWSLAVFRRLAEAEGAVHGIAPEQVHFHEVGATDAIVDIVGTCLGLDWLEIDQLYCSALPTGGGTVWTQHGWLPVPVPATLKLWETRQVPVYSNGIERELVTPTGAALAVTLATSFGAPPAMTINKVGNGAGSRQLRLPNMLRLWIGESLAARGENWHKGSTFQVNFGNKQQLKQSLNKTHLHSHPSDSCLEDICVLETQIDDLNPQAIGYVFEALFGVGAVDVFTQAIGMKKSRPGILLTVICPTEKLTACQEVLFRETTTLGIRRRIQQRAILQREIQEVETDYGCVRVKVATGEDAGKKKIMNVQPEYEDCASIARQYHLPWREVHQLALDAWYRQIQ